MRSLAIAFGISCSILSQCIGQGLDGLKIFPMGGQRGTEASVDLQGKHESWPVSAWSSHPGIVWKALDEKSKMSAVIAADVPNGLAFVRFFESQNASTLLPFVVSEAPILREAEPNDDYGQPQVAAGSNFVLHGILDKSGDVDHVGILMRKGEKWWFSLDANRSLRSPMDGNLQILDARGNILAQNLDRLGMDPAIQWVCPIDGVVSVRVFAFPETPDSTIGYAGGDTFRYLLHAKQGTDSVWEPLQRQAVNITEPNDRTAPAIAVLDASLSKLAYWGALETPADEDAIAIETVQAGHWRVAARSLELGSDADLVLEILDSQGKSLAKQGESGEIRDPVLKDQMKAPGKYTIVVRDLHRGFGENHRYRIELVDERPSVLGTIAKDVFIGEVGKPIEMEIALERTFEFAEEVTLRLLGLPEGVACEPVVSRAGDDSAKKVVVKVTASQPCSIPVQVRIEQAGQGESDYAISGPHRQSHLWLIAKPSP